MGILFVIVLIIAIGCAVSDAFKVWFVGGMIYIFGQGAITVGDAWANVTANPVYQQWHMLIWFIGGVVGTVIFTKILWPRRGRLLQPKASVEKDYQHTIETKLPAAINEPIPENIPKQEPEPKTEEAVAQ